MEHLQIEKDKCIITLNKQFYPEEIIKNGIESFDNNKNINFEKGNIIIKKSNNLNMEKTAYDLCDHLLDIIQGDSQWH